MPNYKYWYLHGETQKIIARIRSQWDRDTNRIVDIVIDAAGPEFDQDMEDDPEAGSDNFYCMLKDADEPLWLEYKTHTVLLAVLELLM